MQALKALNKSGLNYLQKGTLGISLTLAISAPAWSETSLVTPSTAPKDPALDQKAEPTISPAGEPALLIQNFAISTVAPPEALVHSHSAADLSAVTSKNSTLKIEPLQVNSIASDIEEQQVSQTQPTPAASPNPQSETTGNSPAQELDLSPQIIEGSPVLQRWLKQVPNVLEEIRNDPSFRTRLRLGYSQFPSTNQAAGFNVGVEDVFIGRTGLTVSGDYQRSFNGKREAYGADLRYYVLPLGSYVNIAPQVGYRNLTTGNFSTDGVNIGARLMLALSRTGAADISLTQSFVSPGSNDEVGITSLSVGYAVTRNLRLSTDIQKQNSREAKDSRVGIVLEWMP